MVVGETGRCDAPLHGAPVGWGFFGSQASSRAKTNPSSLRWTEPRYQLRSRSAYGLSLHPRPDCKQVARKTGTKTPQIASLTGRSTKGISCQWRLSLAESAGPL